MSGFEPEQLRTDNLVLRTLRPSDIDDVYAACADPLSQRFVPSLPSPYTRDHARWWVSSGAPAIWRSGGANFAIADADSDRLLGAVGVNRVDWETRVGEIGYWIGPWARGRGVAGEATRAIVDWAFAHGLARLEILNRYDNLASQRVAVTAGFRREGVRRGAGRTREGERYDLICWARLAGDPPGPRRRMLPDLPGGKLTDGVVTLRPFGSSDAADLHGLFVLPDVVETAVVPGTPSLDMVTAACRKAASEWLAGRSARCTIRDAGSGDFIGSVGLQHTAPLTGTTLGYSLLPAWRGKGLATRAARLLLRWAFTETRIPRIIAVTDPSNGASQRVLDRLGFHRVGLQRAHLPAGRDGARRDVTLYDIIPGDLTSPDEALR